MKIEELKAMNRKEFTLFIIDAKSSELIDILKQVNLDIDIMKLNKKQLRELLLDVLDTYTIERESEWWIWVIIYYVVLELLES